MPRIQLFIFILLSGTLSAQGFLNVHFLDLWHQDTLITNSSNVRYSGCWGFVRDGKEYAAIGSTEGTHFFHLTADNKLSEAGFIEGKFNSSLVIHREIKTYQNYAYSICNEGNSSLQIIDLSYLPDSVVKVADIQDFRFGKVHNLFIDTANALLYACLVVPIVSGNPTSLIPLRVFSLADPLNPLLVWEGPDDIPEVHDCYVSDNKAILNCGMDGLRVYDFTNPSLPIYLNNLTFYQDQGYNHQGWLSPDGKTYVFADETNGKRLKKCSFSEEDGTIEINARFGTAWEEESVPHNIMISNEFAFVAYYNEGLRIFDLRAIVPKEIAYYDTYPEESSFKMNGAWGVYSNYSSKRIVVSDRQYGLYLIGFNDSFFMNESDEELFVLYPNPSLKGQEIILRSPSDAIGEFTVELFSSQGKLTDNYAVSSYSYLVINSVLSPGSYLVRIKYRDYLGDEQSQVLKLIIQN